MKLLPHAKIGLERKEEKGEVLLPVTYTRWERPVGGGKRGGWKRETALAMIIESLHCRLPLGVIGRQTQEEEETAASSSSSSDW